MLICRGLNLYVIEVTDLKSVTRLDIRDSEAARARP